MAGSETGCGWPAPPLSGTLSCQYLLLLLTGQNSRRALHKVLLGGLLVRLEYLRQAHLLSWQSKPRSCHHTLDTKHSFLFLGKE